MKKIIFSILLFSSFLGIQSCDYITNPIESTPQNPTPTDSSVLRKVLLEDYTGHTCGNCPTAARIITNDIAPVYGNRVVAIAVHAGDFANIGPVPFQDDFKTDAGNEYDAFFEMSTQFGNPVGMINRRDYSNIDYTHGKLPSKWKATIDTIINVPADAGIKIETQFDSAANQLSVTVKTTFLKNLFGNYKVIVLMTQDSIIKAQEDYSQNPSVIPNYIHNHVLRASLNGKWGEDIVISNQVNAQTIVSKSYQYNIPAIIGTISTAPKHSHIVAFVYNTATYEVIQAEEKKIIE